VEKSIKKNNDEDKSSHENYGGKQIQDRYVEKSIKKNLKAVKQTDHEFDEKNGRLDFFILKE
jgi:hypothetical protein